MQAKRAVILLVSMVIDYSYNSTMGIGWEEKRQSKHLWNSDIINSAHNVMKVNYYLYARTSARRGEEKKRPSGDYYFVFDLFMEKERTKAKIRLFWRISISGKEILIFICFYVFLCHIQWMSAQTGQLFPLPGSSIWLISSRFILILFLVPLLFFCSYFNFYYIWLYFNSTTCCCYAVVVWREEIHNLTLMVELLTLVALILCLVW